MAPVGFRNYLHASWMTFHLILYIFLWLVHQASTEHGLRAKHWVMCWGIAQIARQGSCDLAELRCGFKRKPDGKYINRWTKRTSAGHKHHRDNKTGQCDGWPWEVLVDSHLKFILSLMTVLYHLVSCILAQKIIQITLFVMYVYVSALFIFI